MTILYILFDISLHYFVYMTVMCKIDPKSRKMQNKAYPVPCDWNEECMCLYDGYGDYSLEQPEDKSKCNYALN